MRRRGNYMADLKGASESLTALLGKRATTLEVLAVSAKIAATIAAALIALTRIVTLPPWMAYAAITVVMFSTLFVLFADKGSSAALADARQAMDKAIEHEADLENARRRYEAAEEAYDAELERLSQFQAARDLMRAIFEEVAQSTTPMDEVSLIDLTLKQARRSLFLAHGFEMNDVHTICVYQRVVNSSGNAELVCRAHIRAIECDMKQARVWREGIGAAGVALASSREVVVPDLRAVELGSLYHLPEKKVEDDVRYRSIVAEPIVLNGKSDIWGVVVATSSIPNHFSVEDRSYVNVTESLAGIMGLAVKIVRAKQAGMPPVARAVA
jgi:hypothetical protein